MTNIERKDIRDKRFDNLVNSLKESDTKQSTIHYLLSIREEVNRYMEDAVNDRIN